MKKHSTYNLTRRRIDQYRHASANEKHSIERELDSFDQDALDGWEESGLTTAAGMKKSDKVFSAGKAAYVYAAVAAVLITGVVVFVSLPSAKKSARHTAHAHSLKVETSEILLPAQIDTLQELPQVEQVRIARIKTEQKQIAQEPEVTNVPAADQDIPVSTLPEKTISGKPQEMKVRKTAAEINLSDLKLVDYTKYRSKPAIPVERIVITGTPADQESTIGDDVSTTKETIDVPYIEYLSKTAKLISKERWKEALQRLDIILQAYPDDVNAHFYAGICAYNLQLPAKSLEHFSYCQTAVYDNFSVESQWYEAKTYLLTDRQKAVSLLKSIVEQNGYYAQQAKKLLKEIQ